MGGQTTPSQAEGDRDDEERTANGESRPTPSQAEGDRDGGDEPGGGTGG